MKRADRVSTEGNQDSLDNNPFSTLDFSGINIADGKGINLVPSKSVAASGKKGRVNLRREKAGRGGKTVSVLEGISATDERREILAIIKKQCGCGGTVKGECIEIQGDKRDEITKVLTEQGYRVVLSGG